MPTLSPILTNDKKTNESIFDVYKILNWHDEKIKKSELTLAELAGLSHPRRHALDSTIDHSIGSLTINYVVKNDGSKLLNSQIVDDGSYVKIGDTFGTAKLQVDGAIAMTSDTVVQAMFTRSGSPRYGIMHLYDDGTLKVNISAQGNSYLNGGNLGIGTNLPGTKLEISDFTDTIVTINTTGSAGSTHSGVLFNRSGTSKWKIGFGLTDANDNYEFYDYTSSSTKLLIKKNTGYVGIGTTNPTELLEISSAATGATGVWAKIVNTTSSGIVSGDVIGGVQIFGRDNTTNYENVASIVVVQNTTPSILEDLNPRLDFKLYDYNGGANSTLAKMSILNNGYVGIGTTAPTVRLHVEAAEPSSYVGYFNNTDDGISSNGLLVNVKNTSAANTVQRWRANGVELMRVRADGNIGIGTAAPAGKCEIIETGSSGQTILRLVDDKASGSNCIGIELVDDALAHGITGILPTKTYGALLTNTGPCADTGGLRIIGISAAGAHASLKLDAFKAQIGYPEVACLIGNVGIKSGTGVTAIDPTNQAFQIQNNGTAYLTILGDGSLGINTTTIDSKVHIVETGTTGRTILKLTDDKTSGNSCISIKFADDALAHGVTDVLPTKTYGAVLPASSPTDAATGLQIIGISNNANVSGILLNAVVSGTTGAVLNSSKSSGTGKTVLASSDILYQFQNNGTAKANVYGDGSIYSAATIYNPKCRMTVEGGFAVLLTNNTGSASVKGQIVEASGTQGFATAHANDEMPIGVVYEAGIANGASCWVVVGGIADVLMDSGGSTAGYWIGTGSTAGSADSEATTPSAPQHFQEIGHVLETRTGAGLAKGILHFN